MKMFELRKEKAIEQFRIYFRMARSNSIQKICKIMKLYPINKTHQNNKDFVCILIYCKFRIKLLC